MARNVQSSGKRLTRAVIISTMRSAASIRTVRIRAARIPIGLLAKWAAQMAHGFRTPTLSAQRILSGFVSSCLRATHRHPELGSGS
jgi:hypothetical protein